MTEPNYKLTCLLRGRLWRALKRKSKNGSAIALLGCSVDDARKHIERQFTPGMSWTNHGLWHIDHVRPLARFDLTDVKQLAEACHYTNLQPLWARDNIAKGAR